MAICARSLICIRLAAHARPPSIGLCARLLYYKWRRSVNHYLAYDKLPGSGHLLRFSPQAHMLAHRMQRLHNASMSVQITIRDVPEKVRDELAARAAAQGRSMQEFLRAALERLASRPTVDAWLQQVRRRKRATLSRITSEQILKNRDTDRR